MLKTIPRKYIFHLLLLLLFTSAAVAQESTEPIVSTVGPITVAHQESWQVLAGPIGTIVLANFDTAQLTTENPAPDDAVIVQIRLLGLSRVAGLEGDEQSAVNILGGLLLHSMADEDIPEIIELEQDNLTFARADISSEQLPSYVYITILSDATFAAVTFTTAADIAVLDAEEPAMLAIIDTIELDFEAPFPADAVERYEPLTRGSTKDGLPLLGDPDAPVTVMEISSFDCPHCRTFHDTYLPALLPRIAAGEINFVYVPIYGTGSVPEGDSAARAALCGGIENFWAFHDVLFSWQDFGGFAFAYERLQAGADSFGIGAADFDACYISPETNIVLEAARQTTYDILGEQWRTPTALVNGILLDQLSVDNLMSAIDSALADQQ